MPWPGWLGSALIVLLLVDVFLTVLHPQAHGGPVNRVLTRLVWGTFVGVGRLLRRSARDRWLSLGAPFLSAVAIITWAALLITGFALIYGSFPEDLSHTQWESAIGWGDAFYFSGIAASTLGMGDVLVEPGFLRALAVAEGLMGFMLISLSAAYIISIYTAQSSASAFGLEVAAVMGGDPDEGVRRLLADLQSADNWAEGTARRLTRITTDHAQYPILHYFRPPDRRQSTIPQVGSLLTLFERLSEHDGWEVGHPSLLMLRNAVGSYLEEVSRRFAHGTGIEIDEDDDRERIKRYRQALRHLAYRDNVDDEGGREDRGEREG